MKPDAYAVRNDQGFWAGIWNDRETAESVKAKGQPAHNEQVVELQIIRDEKINAEGRERMATAKKPCDDLTTTCAEYPACVCGDAWRQHTDSPAPNTTPEAVAVPSDEELSALSLDSWQRKYHKVRTEISLITWEEVYKRAYVEGFRAAQGDR